MDYELLSTEELKTLLREDFYGIKKKTLEDIMTVSEILTRRMPQMSSAQDSWKQLGKLKFGKRESRSGSIPVGGLHVSWK